MARLIDADKLLAYAKSKVNPSSFDSASIYCRLVNYVDRQPTVDAIPVEWIKKWEVWGRDNHERGRYLGAVSAMLRDWDNEVDVDKKLR